MCLCPAGGSFIPAVYYSGVRRRFRKQIQSGAKPRFVFLRDVSFVLETVDGFHLVCLCRLEGAEEQEVPRFCQRAEHQDQKPASDSRAAA